MKNLTAWVSVVPLAELTLLIDAAIRAFGADAINFGGRIAAAPVSPLLSLPVAAVGWKITETKCTPNW